LDTELTDETRHRESPRVALVTGATGAIGKAIARRIAARSEHEVVLLCRDAAKAEAALADIQRRTGNPRVRYALVDLARQASIAALAACWAGPVHVLVNNAAVAPRRREETPEGIELQFATNVLGYFWTITAFQERLAASAPARVVNVASYWAGGLDLKDLEFQRRPYDNDAAYRQSKQANRMLTVAFADRLKDTGVTVNACHPGDVASSLSRSLGFGSEVTSRTEKNVSELLALVEPDDLLKFGMIPEFVGRLPVVTTLEELDEQALIDILVRPRNALVKQYRRLLDMDGVNLKFTDGALRAIARAAIKNRAGARGLRAIVEAAMLDIMYEVPSRRNVREIVISEDVIEKGEAPLVVLDKAAESA